MDSVDLIGWTSSVVLFATITWQVVKQWRAGTSRGVSRWLFVGQITASTGFLVYSWLIDNWVFVVTNVLLVASAIAGLVIVHIHSRHEGRRSAESVP